MAESSEDDGEKSQEPTQKRLDDARKRGDVPKSQEVNNWFLLSAGALVLLVFAGDGAHYLTVSIKGILANAGDMATDGLALRGLAGHLAITLLVVLGLPFLLLMGAAVFGNVVQNGLLWSSESLTPKFSKISPIAGIGRLFSKQSLANFIKGLVKLTLVGCGVFFAVWPEREKLSLLTELDLPALAPHILSLMLKMMGTALAVLTVLAGADWFWQRQTWLARQRMSHREVREEHKQMEGDPQIKARIRQIRVQRSRKRMMAQVPQASVIITNPTHYAVALRYEAGMGAPVCLAKGMDAVALRIRALATEHEIPIVENPPLARALYASVDVDDEIPTEHYKAVAEVIGYVMKLRRETRLFH